MPVATADSFRRITVQPDNTTVEAEQVGDTLTLVAGAGISLVANEASDQITIINTGSSGAGTTTYIENPFSFNVAGDDSTQRRINNGELVKFIGSSGVTVTSDSEGYITISGPNLSSYATQTYVTSQGYTTNTGTVTSVSTSGSVNGITLTGGPITSSGTITLGGTLGSIANSQLSNSSITVNGTSISLGSSGTITATATNALTFGTGITVSSGSTYNGSSAITISVGGGSPTFTNVTVTGQIIEPYQTYSTAISGLPNITFNCTGGNIWLVNPSGGPGSAWTANFTNVQVTTNQATNITMIIVEGATPFIPSAISINGASITVTWQGGSAPTPSANKTEAVGYSVLQTGASTYTVLGQMVTFG